MIVEIGKTFGIWKCIKELPMNESRGYIRDYVCECLRCGTHKVFDYNYLYLTALGQKPNKLCHNCNELKRVKKEKRLGMKRQKATIVKENIKLNYLWKNMRKRCNCPTCPDYKHYGGRGIKICNEWDNDFFDFYNWATQNGYRATKNRNTKYTIDRIDPNGNYEPSNCRFVDMKIQRTNRR